MLRAKLFYYPGHIWHRRDFLGPVSNNNSLGVEIVTVAFTKYLRDLIIDLPGVEICQASHSESLESALVQFREAEYQARELSYLLNKPSKSDNDFSAVDRRSLHIWAEKGERIIGAMRVTRAPFELSQLVPGSLLGRRNFENYVEFSRLLIGASDGVSALAKRLIASACLYGMETGASGVIAICRAPQRRLFERLGLSTMPESFVVPERQGGKYWLVHGSWSEITKTLSLHEEEVISQRQTAEII
jgi:hypothetical protein